MGARPEPAQDHGGASAYRGDGKVDREPRSDQNERGIALERVKVIAGKSSTQIPNVQRERAFAVWNLGD